MKRRGKVLIDANILIHAAAFSSADTFEWITELYEEIYIHQVVLEELKVPSVRKKVEEQIHTGKWMIFDPDNEKCLSDELFSIYEMYLIDIRQAFKDLDQKKQKQGRPLKHTNDLGEMHCLAAAMLLGASIICSNDYDVKEVIEDSSIKITIDEEKESMYIQQDTLLDFCIYLFHQQIAPRKTIRKFLKSAQPERIGELDRMIEEM